MAPIVIYGMPASAPCRILTMTCEVLGLDYEFKIVNLQAGENKTPEYLKMNPHHTVPTLVDGDFITNESRAAAAYLVNKYGGDKKNDVYPECPVGRARVDQRMYFDMGVFYKAFGECVYPILFGKDTEIAADKLARFVEVMGWVRDYVKEGKFAAGTGHLTLADICFVATYSTIKATDAFDLSAFNPELNDWFETCKTLIPNYEKANGEGAAGMGGWYKGQLAAKKSA
jgi:glutathione S-transferase